MRTHIDPKASKMVSDNRRKALFVNGFEGRSFGNKEAVMSRIEGVDKFFEFEESGGRTDRLVGGKKFNVVRFELDVVDGGGFAMIGKTDNSTSEGVHGGFDGRALDGRAVNASKEGYQPDEDEASQAGSSNLILEKADAGTGVHGDFGAVAFTRRICGEEIDSTDGRQHWSGN